MKEEQIVIAVGQFIPRKGFDVLMQAARHLSNQIGVYIIGGEPSNEYLKLKEKLKLENIHFVGFKSKQDLALYYQAADCTAFPTREDIWGLITNESMAFGVPVVATDRCISALEVIQDDVNGCIVPVEDVESLADGIITMLKRDSYMSCICIAMRFTIEQMARAHANLLL